MEPNPHSSNNKKRDGPSMYEVGMDVDEDDEETLDVEEALAPIIEPEEELRMLADDLDVNVGELRFTWRQNPEVQRILEGGEEDVGEGDIQDVEEASSDEIDDEEVEEACSSASTPGPDVPNGTRSNNSGLGHFYMAYVAENRNSEDEDEDDEYVPQNGSSPVRYGREVRIGPQYQIEVPSGPTFTSSQENIAGDELIWPSSIPLGDREFASYLSEAERIMYSMDDVPSTSSHTRVSDLALQCLRKCNFEPEPALEMLKSLAPKKLKGKKTRAAKKAGKKKCSDEPNDVPKKVDKKRPLRKSKK